MKNNIKLFIGILIGVILTGTMVYAASLTSNDISYGDGTVKDALDDLYSVSNNSSSGTNQDLVIPYIRLSGVNNFLDSVFYLPLNGYDYLDVTYGRGTGGKMGIYRGTPDTNIGKQLVHTFTRDTSFTDFDISDYQDAYFYVECYPSAGQDYYELRNITLHN